MSERDILSLRFSPRRSECFCTLVVDYSRFFIPLHWTAERPWGTIRWMQTIKAPAQRFLAPGKTGLTEIGLSDFLEADYPEDQKKNEDHQKEKEEDFSDPCRCAGDSSETQCPGDDWDDEKYNCPFQHIIFRCFWVNWNLLMADSGTHLVRE